VAPVEHWLGLPELLLPVAEQVAPLELPVEQVPSKPPPLTEAVPPPPWHAGIAMGDMA
jgi:hypothetical protein